MKLERNQDKLGRSVRDSFFKDYFTREFNLSSL